MCGFEENPRKNIKFEVRRRDTMFTREVGEYSWGLKVQEEFSWSFKGAL
jgi:hypothetical protein